MPATALGRRARTRFVARHCGHRHATVTSAPRARRRLRHRGGGGTLARDGDAARPARRRGRAIRRPTRARHPARGRHDRGLDLSRARPALPRRGVPAPRAGPAARRPDPHLVALDTRAARDVLRRDPRGHRDRPARPAHVRRRDRRDRAVIGREAADPRDGPRRPRSRRVRARRDRHDQRGDHRRGARCRGGAASQRLGGAGCRVAATATRRPRRPDLHLGHDRHAEGRHAFRQHPPRQRPCDGRGLASR